MSNGEDIDNIAGDMVLGFAKGDEEFRQALEELHEIVIKDLGGKASATVLLEDMPQCKI